MIRRRKMSILCHLRHVNCLHHLQCSVGYLPSSVADDLYVLLLSLSLLPTPSSNATPWHVQLRLLYTTYTSYVRDKDDLLK
jgi:hypothetical protein